MGIPGPASWTSMAKTFPSTSALRQTMPPAGVNSKIAHHPEDSLRVQLGQRKVFKLHLELHPGKPGYSPEAPGQAGKKGGKANRPPERLKPACLKGGNVR